MAHLATPIGAISLNDGYTGNWQRGMDSSTGTIRMGVREYYPRSGRFISADPLQGSSTNPQQLDRYKYVGNNPLTRNDLEGLSWIGDAWDWTKDKVSKVNNATKAMFPMPHYGPVYDNSVAKAFRDPRISMSLAIGIGLPGGNFGEAASPLSWSAACQARPWDILLI